MGYSGDKQRQYQREWIASRRNAWIEANGPCSCGSDVDLEVDHVDPSTKLLDPSQIWSRRESVRVAELAKCQVLCRKCHKEKTRLQLSCSIVPEIAAEIRDSDLSERQLATKYDLPRVRIRILKGRLSGQ